MCIVNVALGERSYPIHIDTGLLDDAACFAPHIAGKQVMVISDRTVAPLYLERLLQTLSAFELHTWIIPDGEQNKTLETAESIFEAMLRVPCDRATTLVALGGGVVGDITGFAAALYQRGVPYIQVPTTLLAQVDSSVGGKTAVNHRLGKNMIGAFYQPRCVVADMGTLATLPERELVAGLAEVIKYGLIRDLSFFQWLEDNLVRLRQRDTDALAYVVERSCTNKAAVVAADETERGVRAILNLGHSFGHAIESATGYKTWLHGEAVAVGMLMAADLSHRLGWLSGESLGRIDALLRHAGLPTRPPAGLNAAQFLERMAVDKKVLSGKLRLVLLGDIGSAQVVDDYARAGLHETLEAFTN